MKQAKALFFDVDSTLYTHRIHDIPESTKKALNKLKQHGYKIAVATSRCRYETRNLPRFFHEFPFDAKIYDGGALVMEKNQMLEHHPIQINQVQTLVNLSKAENFAMRYSTFDGDYYERECATKYRDQFFKLYLNMPEVKPYEKEAAYNLLAFIERKEQKAKLYQHMENCAIIEHSGGTYEITAKGIDKSIGVKCLAEQWQIAMEEVICFGDGANDVGMLTQAGLGIAMGNGNPKAKEAADIVCGHIDEDGLYNICKELQLF